MKVDDIKVNQLIEIEYQPDPNTTEFLPSRIEEKSDRFLYFAAPIRKGELVPFRIGQKINVVFTTKNNTYAFTTVIQDRQREPIPIIKVDKPEYLSRIQRRAYVRLPINLKLSFTILPEDKTEYTGITLDISGGGVLILTKALLEKGQLLNLNLELPNREPIKCKSKVVRILQRARSSKEDSKVAIQFLDITESKRDKIFNYIFEKQREWIRRGILE